MARLADVTHGTAIVNLYVLPTGTLALPRRWILAGRDDDNNIPCPVYSFLIEHPGLKTKVMFDLGLKKDLEAYPTVIKAVFSTDHPDCEKDARDILVENEIQPSEIDAVVLSHVHHDHIGEINHFPKAELVVGPGTLELFKAPAFPEDPMSPFLTASVRPPSGKVRELPPIDSPEWKPLGDHWEKTFDYFGDGSFYLLDSPGHMPGHIMALVRTAADEYVVLGGDCCHDRLLYVYKDKYDIGTRHGPGKGTSMHKDPVSARHTINGLKHLHKLEDVLIVLAHDYAIAEIIDLIPKPVNGWRKTGLKERTDEIGLRYEREDLARLAAIQS